VTKCPDSGRCCANPAQYPPIADKPPHPRRRHHNVQQTISRPPALQDQVSGHQLGELESRRWSTAAILDCESHPTPSRTRTPNQNSVAAAYDSREIYEATENQGARVVVPPIKNARVNKHSPQA
jgi:hypothetical protein